MNATIEAPLKDVVTFAREELSSRAWDFLPEDERVRRLELGRQVGLDVYDIRADAWGIPRTTARVRLILENPKWKPSSRSTYVLDL